MNDLSVYYCPKCGRYAYVQRNSHISCSACSYDMKLLSVSCTEFMHLSLEKRNVLILDHILSEAKQNSSDTTSDQDELYLTGSCSYRHMFFSMNMRLHELQKENQQLNHTVDWMHQTIWKLLSRNKELEKRLEHSRSGSS